MVISAQSGEMVPWTPVRSRTMDAIPPHCQTVGRMVVQSPLTSLELCGEVALCGKVFWLSRTLQVEAQRLGCHLEARSDLFVMGALSVR